MNNKKGISVKALAILMLLVLLIGGTIGGTFAWLATKTESIVNTFVAGDIQIELKEHVLDITTGQWKSPEEYTTTGNQNILALPGRTIQKDPTVTVLKGSEPCYLRVFIKINWSVAADGEFDEFEYNDWFEFNNAAWSFKRIFDGTYQHNQMYVGYDIYELTYQLNNGIVDAREENVSIPILMSMTIPAYLDNDEINALTDSGITLIAQAIQADGFDSAEKAFDPTIGAGYPAGWEPQSAPESN